MLVACCVLLQTKYNDLPQDSDEHAAHASYLTDQTVEITGIHYAKKKKKRLS